MFDFYVACVLHWSSISGTYYWLPKKIYSSRGSCIRFFKSYKCKSLELPTFGILRVYQDQVIGVEGYDKD